MNLIDDIKKKQLLHILKINTKNIFLQKKFFIY